MEPTNVSKLSPEDKDNLVLQLEREEADLTERDYDRYQDLIKQDLGGLTTKKVVQSLLALFDSLTDGLLLVLGFALLVLVVAFLNGHLDQAWPFLKTMLTGLLALSPDQFVWNLTSLCLVFLVAMNVYNHWRYRQATLRLQVSVDAMVRVQAEIAQRPVVLTRLASYLYEYGFQRLLAEEEETD